MSTFAMHRRHPAAAVVVMLFGLTVTGLLYSAFDGSTANAATSETQIAQGKMLFQEGCATCHGTNGAGTTDAPNIQNVGAAGAHDVDRRRVIHTGGACTKQCPPGS